MSRFPEALTEEEEYLLERYKILREKKRALQKLKEKAETKVKPAVKRESPDTFNTPEDAKKKAEMLVASGCVKISKATVDREFKRARMSEKKLTKESLSDHESSILVEKKHPSKTAMKEMYTNSFVRAGRSDNDTGTSLNGTHEATLKNCVSLSPRPDARIQADSSHRYRGFREQRRGNTIFVRGYGLKEDIVKTAFNKFGTVIDARYEKDRSHGFVTFKTCEEAEKAIDEMNGTMVSDVHIEVSLARKQFHMENARGNQPLWSSRDFRPRGRRESSTEGRELKTYEDGDFF